MNLHVMVDVDSDHMIVDVVEVVVVDDDIVVDGHVVVDIE